MIRVEMRNNIMILTEKHQIYLYYHQVKLISVNVFASEKVLHSDQSRMIKQASLLILLKENVWRKRNKKVDALKSLNFSNR